MGSTINEDKSILFFQYSFVAVKTSRPINSITSQAMRLNHLKGILDLFIQLCFLLTASFMHPVRKMAHCDYGKRLLARTTDCGSA